MFLVANYYHIALAAGRTASRLVCSSEMFLARLQPSELCMLALACMPKLIMSARKLDGSTLVQP